MREEPNPFEAPSSLARHRVSLDDMAAAQPVEADYAMELGHTRWRARFTPDHLYLARDDNPHAHRLSHAELVECGRVRTLIGQRAVVEFRWPDRERVTFSPEATVHLRRWLGASADGLMKKSMQSGWFFDLFVGVLFLVSYSSRPGDLVGAVAGAMVLTYALLAKLRPVRSLWILRAVGWGGIASSFLVTALSSGRSVWIVLVVPLLWLGIRGSLRLHRFFG
jgi:hypothetical protein